MFFGFLPVLLVGFIVDVSVVDVGVVEVTVVLVADVESKKTENSGKIHTVCFIDNIILLNSVTYLMLCAII